MAKSAFKAVVLDLFDTLVKWEPERLPLIELNGKETHSTLPWILPLLSEHFGASFNLERFLKVYHEVVEEINAERDRDGTEITCGERFLRTLERYASGPPDGRVEFAEHLTRLHMDGVRAVTWAPAERVAAVRRLAPDYRLGLLSNFDDAQCGHEVVSDTGVADLFEAIIISAEIRLRKPNPLIFRRMLSMLRLEPQDVLFVGDTPRDDIYGPQRVGMHTAWITRGAVAVPEGIPEPDIMIADLAQLPAALGV